MWFIRFGMWLWLWWWCCWQRWGGARTSMSTRAGSGIAGSRSRRWPMPRPSERARMRRLSCAEPVRPQKRKQQRAWTS